MKFFFVNLIVVVFLYILCVNRKYICSKLNLIDTPGKLSIHKSKALLFGGIFLFSSFVFNYFIIYLNDGVLDKYISIYLLLSFFLIAIIDDIKNLDANLRLFFTVTACLIIFYFEPSLRINSLSFFFNNSVFINDNIIFSYTFSALCILLFVNAFNFIDGIDGLASSIGLSFFLYLIFKNFEIFEYYYVFIISIIVFLFLNLKYRVFLGDSGNYLISVSIAAILIKENYYNPTLYFAEEIFLLFIIPGIDMLRLFFIRILKNQNPFRGDKNHLHHKILKKFGKSRTVLLYLLIVNVPIYTYMVTERFLILLILITISVYLILLKYTS